jgi:hypothetical protein
MTKPERPIPPQVIGKPFERAKHLAEKMARVLHDEEDVSDVALAIALLTSGVVNHYAGNLAASGDLVKTIRKLEDGLLAKSAAEAAGLKVQ